jgi:hypothetical protein
MSKPMRFSHPLALVALFALSLAPALVGCHARSRPADSAPLTSVGFVLPAGAGVERGAIVTKPPGREEGFLAFVATGTQKWVEACRGEAGGATPLFSFQTDGHGAPALARSEAGGTARERCLAAHAIATPGTGLPPATQVTVQLALR